MFLYNFLCFVPIFLFPIPHVSEHLRMWSMYLRASLIFLTPFLMRKVLLLLGFLFGV